MTDYQTANLKPATFDRLEDYMAEIDATSKDEAVRRLLDAAEGDDDPEFVRLEADAVERIADSVEERMRGAKP